MEKCEHFLKLKGKSCPYCPWVNFFSTLQKKAFSQRPPYGILLSLDGPQEGSAVFLDQPICSLGTCAQYDHFVFFKKKPYHIQIGYASFAPFVKIDGIFQTYLWDYQELILLESRFLFLSYGQK